MLSEHDRRELALIEERLRSDDRRFTDIFHAGRAGPRRDRRWTRRALVGFGAFMLLVGLAAGAAGLFLQGLLVFGAGVGWTLLLRWTAASKGRVRRIRAARRLLPRGCVAAGVASPDLSEGHRRRAGGSAG